MFDISILIYEAEPQTSELIRGDIISVSEAHDDVCSHPRFVILNMTNIPSNKSHDDFIKDFGETLKGPPLDQNGDPDPGRKRHWSMSFNDMKAFDRAEILQNRRLSLTWGEAKKLIFKRPFADSEPVAIKDDDL